MAYRFWELCYMYTQLIHTYTHRGKEVKRGVQGVLGKLTSKQPAYVHKQKGSRGTGKPQQQQQTPKVRWVTYNYHAATIITSFFNSQITFIFRPHMLKLCKLLCPMSYWRKKSLSERYVDSLMKSSVWEVRNCLFNDCKEEQLKGLLRCLPQYTTRHSRY